MATRQQLANQANQARACVSVKTCLRSDRTDTLDPDGRRHSTFRAMDDNDEKWATKADQQNVQERNVRCMELIVRNRMSLLQLHAAIFSILIATLDSTECVLGFSRHQQLNGQKSQGLQTRLSRCFFLTRDQDRWNHCVLWRAAKFLGEDFHRQRCEVKARSDAKVCCKILTALGRSDGKTWNNVPLELRKDIERIHRNLGHASGDQLEKLFRDANVSYDAISALKHFRRDACDRLKQPP